MLVVCLQVNQEFSQTFKRHAPSVLINPPPPLPPRALSMQLPSHLYCELQYRQQPGGGGAGGEWISVRMPSGQLEAEVTSLQPGTKYAFRARPCKVGAAGDMLDIIYKYMVQSI
jgi:hypothetical protein